MMRVLCDDDVLPVHGEKEIGHHLQSFTIHCYHPVCFALTFSLVQLSSSE